MWAVNPPPSNDTVCYATDLGTLGIPGACPGYPYGDTITVNGSTTWANYNSLDFSPVHCFPLSGSPDVWYKFRGTGSYLYFEMTGFNGLDSFFVKLFSSQGSCLALIPLTCEISTSGFMATTFLTPEVGGEYYLQIGGNTYNQVGDFVFSFKSFNDCIGCVKNAEVELTPAPWHGRYGTSDTVTMCVTVNRWELLTTANLHSIIPIFGDDWDTATLVPVSGPNAATGWNWFTGVNTPFGTNSGYFFDSDFDGNPLNNPGENGNILTSWEACWSIASKPFCNTFDLAVEVYISSDYTTGLGNTANVCEEYTPIHMGLAAWCCPSPIVTVIPGANCGLNPILMIDPASPNGTDSFNITLYDTSMTAISYVGSVTGLTTMTAPGPGYYLVEAYNVSASCPGFVTVQIAGAFTIDMTQTSVGCDSVSGAVLATTTGSNGPLTYNWPGITTWTDSIATGLAEGFVVVEITDSFGCTIIDSLYVTTLPMPGADFGYADHTYCSNDDTIQVYFDPFTSGGAYTLLAPLASTIIVNPTTGTISLNGSTVGTPYWIYVEYRVGTLCQDIFIDSVQIVQQPPPPTATSAQVSEWCIGNTPPVLTIATASWLPLWYDPQTTGSGIGFSFTPPLNGSTTPGSYLYGVSFLTDLAGGCASIPTLFSVTAVAYPNVTFSGDTTICEGETALLYASSGSYVYSWTPTPTSGISNLPVTTTSPASSSSYSCAVANSGCITTGVVNVIVQSASDCAFLVYNGFTPNGDDRNDTWVIDGADSTAGIHVIIFNRWGEHLWEGHDYDNQNVVWRGRDGSGNQVPEGTYFFIIYQRDVEKQTGWIELSR